MNLLNVDFKQITFLTDRVVENDYFHGVSIIFINISLDRWLEQINAKDRKFLLYYNNQKVTKTRKFDGETRLELSNNRHYTPDLICGFNNQQEKQFVFCLEIYNGSKIGYVEQQLIQLF